MQKECVTEMELKSSITEFEGRLAKVDELQSQIEDEVEQSQIEEIVEEAFCYREKQKEVKIRAQICLQKLSEIKESHISDLNTSQTSTSSHVGRARLPKLELPKFSGNYLEFTSFFDKFLAIVDGSELPAVTKFTYLQSLLTGEALASINGLTVTDDSYPVAKEILTKRYGRKERIIFSHIQTLLSLQVDCRKSNGLWSLYDSLQSHVRCLESLGVSGDTYGVILTPLILSRLPQEIRMEWAREGEGRESDLAFLLDFLFREIKRRERSETFDKSHEMKNQRLNDQTKKPAPSVATFHANSCNQNKTQCGFCRKTNHASEQCYSIKGLNGEELRGKVRDSRLCYICLGKHFARDCYSKIKCKGCGGRHNSILCTKGNPSVSASSDQSTPLREAQPQSQNQRNVVSYAHFENQDRTTVMQVVKTKLQSKGGKIVEANVLFDGGSDLSFVTQDLVKKLDLKKSGEETFSFSGFGDAESGPRTKRKVYNLELGGISVKLVGIDTLCAEMYRSPVPRQVISKFNIEFSEDFEVGRSIKVDILIGLDYYWELVSPERVQIDSLVAQKTRCGWMLSGSYAGKSVSKGFQMLCLNNISENVVRSLWELDDIGIVDGDASPAANKVMAKFEESTTFQKGRYEVNLPWKENQKGRLMDNKGIAEKRLHSLSRRLAGNPKLKEAYNENLSEMEKAGMIKEVSKCEKREGPIFYLPHRPVVRRDSITTKVRPVFDASAKGYNGVSLNDIETGPTCVTIEDSDKEPLLKVGKWSSLAKVTRIMSWVLRFVTRCRKKPMEHCDGDKLTSAEVSQADKQLTLMTQSEHFEEEIACLKAGKHVAKSSNLYKLSPFIGEDGLLRARCRLNYSDLTFDEKFPILLPKCHFSLLIVREKHAQLKHAGVSQMITAVRNHYWVIGLRSLARKVKGECLSCKRVDARACQEPMAPLMEARLKKAPAFNTTGLDYAGPVYCKDFPGEKFYILLFTCAVTRAVHLELVNSLSLTHFLLAFRRFVSRRGLPKTVFSDNAKTFKSASTELLKLYGSNSPYWRFSVPRAPWWGGWRERMVRNMKVSLKKTIGLKSLERTELETLLTEVEACLNSRPLTFVGDDIDNGHPLTPSHFLLGRGSHLDKVSCEPSLDVSPELIKEKSKALEGRCDMFWKQWQDEYLKHLPLPKRRDKFGKLEVGSVVLIREDNCPRLQWPMGVVERLIPGKDGVARTVEVRTKRGNFFRPIQRLHGMELNEERATEEVRKENVYHTRFGRPSKSTVRFNIDSN